MTVFSRSDFNKFLALTELVPCLCVFFPLPSAYRKDLINCCYCARSAKEKSKALEIDTNSDLPVPSESKLNLKADGVIFAAASSPCTPKSVLAERLNNEKLILENLFRRFYLEY